MKIFSTKYKEHYKKNFQVAYPVTLGQVGHMMAGFADSIMVGWVSSVHLAAASLANHLYIVVMLLGVGMCTGLTPLVSKAYGQENNKRIRRLFKHGLIINTLFGVVVSLIMFLSSCLFPYLGQPAEVVDIAIPFFYLLCISVIPYMIFLNFKHFIEGLQYTKPGMIVIIICNLMNIGLNFLFIYGYFGFPALGLLGAGVSTLISRICMPIMMFGYIYFHKNLKKYITGQNLKIYSKKIFYEIMKIGTPIGLQSSIEVAAFSMSTIMTGWLSKDALAANQIAINLSALIYLMASGIASATTIRISNLLGKRKLYSMRIAGYSSLIMVIVFMLTTSVICILSRNIIPRFFLDELNVIQIASSLIVIGGIYQVFDGIQVVALGALRGLEDVKIPTLMSIFTYWVICVPVSYLLGIVLGFGAEGIWFGNLIGLFLAAVLLYSRYEKISRKILKDACG